MPQSLYNELHKYFGIKNKTASKNDDNKVKKYFTPKLEGERNNAMISFLGMLVTQPKFRTYEILYKMAYMYNKVYIEVPLEEEEIEKIVNSALDYAKPYYCDEKGRITDWLLVEYVLNSIPMYKRGNLFYLYNEKLRVYEDFQDNNMRKLYYKYPIEHKDRASSKAREFTALLTDNCESLDYNDDCKNYINCKNGIIDINKNELINHDSKYKLEVKFNANYIPMEEYKDKYSKSKFKKFLEDILDKETIITLQEAWGSMISPHSEEIQKCYIYLGEGSNGKSTLFSIQEALIGDNRKISGIGLGDFGKEFILSMAEGKFVNIVRDNEVKEKQVIDGLFKSIVCGEPVTVNRKNKDLQRMQFNMSFFYGLNRMPQIVDKSEGFFRRIIIIPFNTTFGNKIEVEKGLKDKVKIVGIANEIINYEMDLVFAWAYEGLQRLKSNNWIITENKATDNEKEEYRQEVDSSYAFCEIHIIKEKGMNIKASIVYQAYTSWCSEEGIRAMNGTQFGRQLKSLGISKTRKSDGIYYLDIKLKNKKIL